MSDNLDDVIKKINEYAKLSKKRNLTEEELKDRKKLREIFLENFRGNFKSILDNVKIVDKKEKKEKF